MFKYIFYSMVLLLFVACSTNQNKVEEVKSFSFIEANVVDKFDDKLIVKLKETNILNGNTYSDRLTNKVIKSSYLIPNLSTRVNSTEAKVLDVRSNEITLKINTLSFKKDQKVKIYIPKKSIAVVDFSLINSKNSDINKFAMEDMTTKLVQSGQYKVLERAKLNAVLKEQELVDSGLLDVDASSVVGKLLSADILLTGSFSQKSNYYMANLRLVDVKTGTILSAISDKILASEFRVEQLKDISNLTQNFEGDKLSKAWNKTLLNSEFSRSKSSIDKTQGANGTSSSFKLGYFFKRGGWTKTQFQNERFRDLSSYSGIEFFAKADDDYSTIRFVLEDKNYHNAKQNRWTVPVNLTSKWKKYRIDFDSLIIGTQFARKSPGGDGKLDLDSVMKIGFYILARENSIEEKHNIWLDEITLY